MTNKPKYAFKEYLNGAKKSTEYYDKLLHGTSNVIVGVVVTLIIILMIIML